MPKSQAFAIATQQSHATGHTPQGYGTAEGRRKAKKKYDAPKKSYVQTADPSSKSKTSSLVLLMGFSDELQKIAGVTRKKRTDTPAEKPSATPESFPPPLATAAGET